MTVSSKGLILVAVPLVFQLAFVLTVIRFQRDYADAQHWANHTKVVIAQAHELRTTIFDADAAIRGYIISPTPTFAEAFWTASAAVPEQLAALDLSVRETRQQSEKAGVLRTAANANLAWHQEKEKLVRDGNAQAAAEMVRTGHGELLAATFRREVDEFLAEEDRLDRNRAAALDRSRARLNTLAAVGAVAAVGVTLALAVVFYRSITRRFAVLESTARRLAAGDSLPPPLGGRDEIARVDRAFRDMAGELTRASEAVRDLYDYAPCGYHSVDPSGTLVAMNRTELQWLGYESAEVVGKRRFAELVAPSSFATYQQGFATVRERGSVSDVEVELVRKDGSTFPVLIGSSSVRDADGHYLRSRTTLTDLTERKRAEAATRLFATVTQDIPLGLFILRLDGADAGDTLRIYSGNAAAARLLNLSIAEVAGRAVTDAFPHTPADRLQRYAAVAASGRADDLGEFQYAADRWCAVLAFPLPERSVGVAFQDVTDRNLAEAEVRRLNAELEDRVRERTAELEAVNRELVHKNAENEMFVYSVSHDLRSPLVNLQGFSKELEKGARQLAGILSEEGVPADVRDRGRGLLDGKMATSVGFIQTAVLRLSGIIDALLRLSRVGRVEYQWEAIDVGRVVARVVDAAHGTVAERGATVRVAELPAAWGDRTAIEQVFANLVGNALTYLDPSRPGLIEVAALPLDEPAGFRTYTVRDNGLGIADGHRQKIFQAFQRAHPGVGSGEGLGLAIVARVAERHHGRVWAESTPGAGSCFFVSLPVPPAAFGVDTTPAGVHSAQGG